MLPIDDISYAFLLYIYIYICIRLLIYACNGGCSPHLVSVTTTRPSFLIVRFLEPSVSTVTRR